MDYNNIILELLDRIKNLENEVKELKERFIELENNKDSNNNNKGIKSINNESNMEGSSIYKIDTLKGDKYYKFTQYLISSSKDMIELTFKDIENILGFELSPSKRKYRANWSNTTSISFCCSYLKAGYKVSKVNINKEIVIFTKISSNNSKESKTYNNTGDKYFKLKEYLKSSNKDYIRLYFKEIEEILGFKLSSSARTYEAFWSNSRSHSISCAWLDANYKNIKTNIKEEYVEFKKYEY